MGVFAQKGGGMWYPDQLKALDQMTRAVYTICGGQPSHKQLQEVWTVVSQKAGWLAEEAKRQLELLDAKEVGR